MTHKQRLKIARDIAQRGIRAELATVQRTAAYQDMDFVDREAIRKLTEQMAESVGATPAETETFTPMPRW